MPISEILSSNFHHILKADLPAGGQMPEHIATSDAFVVPVKGKAVIRFTDGEDVTIQVGEHFNIPANRKHTLSIIDDFVAYIVFDADGKIQMEK